MSTYIYYYGYMDIWIYYYGFTYSQYLYTHLNTELLTNAWLLIEL